VSASGPDVGRRTGVSSYTEWDPLEEVVVGRVTGARIPRWHPVVGATMPAARQEFFRQHGGRPFPPDEVRAAEEDLDGFVALLESNDVRVRRPLPIDDVARRASPDNGRGAELYSAMPRDLILVVGDELIEAPMAWPARANEAWAFRPLLNEYFRAGARWSAAPRPRLSDGLYRTETDADGDFVLTEQEPVWDAADFFRCGRDLFGQLSHVTNRSGFRWLRQHLSGRFRIHELRFHDPRAMHIDATILPLAPGKILLNSARISDVPEAFRDWEPIWAPPPTVDDTLFYMSSGWIHMNVLSLDSSRVIVEASEAPLIRTLERAGLAPIPCPFRNFMRFGGSFHCATLDVRRRGTLESYFD
jgi:glycine amidinotransferase